MSSFHRESASSTLTPATDAGAPPRHAFSDETPEYRRAREALLSEELSFAAISSACADSAAPAAGAAR